jgi:hypothetical protein
MLEMLGSSRTDIIDIDDEEDTVDDDILEIPLFDLSKLPCLSTVTHH